jgi:hypothetical protein
MKIAFVCGSLDPGRDGVGDYSRQLAAALLKEGHDARIISWSDRGASSSELFQYCGDIQVPVLRMPESFSDGKRLFLAQKWVEDFDPEILSLQYVPFSYHHKGLPISLADKLNKISKGRKWQIMFHELWVGMDTNSSMKLKIWGLIQKILIKRLISKMKPLIVQTQITLYQRYLENMGVKSTLLPLFSNIPVVSAVNLNDIDKKANQLAFLIFGGLHSTPGIEELAKDALKLGEQEKKSIKLIILGRNGKEQEKWINIWSRNGAIVEVMGEQSELVISKTLQNSFVGISTTPLALIGKSGAVAAMLEHNLAVINLSRKWETRLKLNLSVPQGIFPYSQGSLSRLLIKANIDSNNVDQTAKTFLKSISE